RPSPPDDGSLALFAPMIGRARMYPRRIWTLLVCLRPPGSHRHLEPAHTAALHRGRIGFPASSDLEVASPRPFAEQAALASSPSPCQHPANAQRPAASEMRRHHLAV